MDSNIANMFLTILLVLVAGIIFLFGYGIKNPKRNRKKISILTYDSPENRVIVGNKERVEKAIHELDPSATIQHFADLQDVLLVSTVLSTELISIFQCVNNVYKPVQLSKMLKESKLKQGSPEG